MNRFKEPSTWAGIGAIVTNAASAWASHDPTAIAGVIAGILAMFIREKGAH